MIKVTRDEISLPTKSGTYLIGMENVTLTIRRGTMYLTWERDTLSSYVTIRTGRNVKAYVRYSDDNDGWIEVK